MATREQLEKALRNAHNAGDTASAQRFADEIRKLDSAPSKAQADFDALPIYMKPVKALDDLLRVGSDALTYGGIDYLRTLAGTQPDVETARQATGEARERSGVAGDLTAAASATLPMLLMPQLAAPATMGPVMRTATNAGIAALEGSAWGGLDALGHGRDVTEGQLSGAAFGFGANALSGILGKGLDMAFERAASRSRPKTQPRDLRLSKDRAYNAMEDELIGFRPAAVDDLIDRIDDTTKDAYPGVQGGVRAARSRAKKNLTGNQGHTGPGQGFGRVRTMTEIDKERQNFRRDAVNNPQTTNKEMGLDVLKTIDDWMDDAVNNPNAVSAGSGNPIEALGKLQEARKLNQRVEKLDMLDERIGRSERQAERNLYSGEDSTLKQNVGGILDNPKLRDQYSAAEREQMRTVNRAGNTLRQGGRMAPGGGLAWPAATAGAGIGFALGGPGGAAIGGALPSVAGILSKKLASRATRKEAEKLFDMVSSGQDFKIPPGMTAGQRKQLTRLLTALGITSAED